MGKSAVERKRDERDRKHKAGLVLLAFWVAKADEARVRQYVLKLNNARTKEKTA
jgi:hypothetical protein